MVKASCNNVLWEVCVGLRSAGRGVLPLRMIKSHTVYTVYWLLDKRTQGCVTKGHHHRWMSCLLYCSHSINCSTFDSLMLLLQFYLYFILSEVIIMVFFSLDFFSISTGTLGPVVLCVLWKLLFFFIQHFIYLFIWSTWSAFSFSHVRFCCFVCQKMLNIIVFWPVVTLGIRIDKLVMKIINSLSPSFIIPVSFTFQSWVVGLPYHQTSL